MTPTTPVETKYTKFSCPNPACSLFNQPGRGNIAYRSWTGTDKSIERLRCTLCKSGRAQEHHQQAVCELDVEGVQADEAHSKRRLKKVEWIHTALAMGSLFIPILNKKIDERVEQLLTPALSETLKADAPAKTHSTRIRRKRAGPHKKAA